MPINNNYPNNNSVNNFNSNKSMNKHFLYNFLILVSFVIGVIIGASIVCKYLDKDCGVGPSMYQAANMNEEKKYDNTFDDGWRAARQKLVDTGYFMESEMKQLGGTIKSVDDKSIILSTYLLNPLDSESLMTRVVKIDDNTKINIIRSMTEDEIKASEAENRNKAAKLKAELANEADEMKKMELSMEIDMLEMGMMDYTIKESASIADLKESASITVIADENIAAKEEFVAAEITMQSMNDMANTYIPDMTPVEPPIDNMMPTEIDMAPVTDMPVVDEIMEPVVEDDMTPMPVVEEMPPLE